MAKMLGKNETNKPYNAKNTDIEKAERGLVGADDGLAYVKKKNYAVIGQGRDMMEKVEQEAPELEEEQQQEEEEEQKYQKVDWKKRHDDLKRHHDRKLNDLKSELQSLKESRPKFSPPKTPEELATFRAENPDIYDVVETVAHMRATDEMEQLQNTVKRLEEQLQAEQMAKAYAQLKILAPDYEQISASDDFKNWASEQPREIQAWIYENKDNAQLAAKAINLYKADRGGQVVQQRQAVRPSAADAISVGRANDESRGRQERIFTTSEIGSMSWKQYEALREDIDRAHREGRVVKG